MAYDGVNAGEGGLSAVASKSIGDYLAVVWSRRTLVLVPAILLMILSFLVAFLLPPVYRSQATILIEEPDVPPELVLSTITGFADERIQAITQRVNSTQNLSAIIERYNLYPKSRAKLPLTEVVDKMRDDIKSDLISADVKDPRSGRAAQATIAFTVSFDYRDPATAQRVANEIVNLYLSENLRERQSKANETTNFLSGETARLQKLINDLEKRISDLKQTSAGSLPEQMDYNLQRISRAETELRDLDRRVDGLEQQRIYLEAELLKMSPFGSYVVDGQRVMSPGDQLKALKTQLITLSGQYGANHPDVVKLRRQVTALEGETGGSDDAQTLRREQERLSAELAQAKERYSESHPDVIKLQRNLDAVQASLKQSRGKPQAVPTAAQPDNPAYIQLQAQLQVAKSDLKAIAEQRIAIKKQIAEVDKLVAATPLVEREYGQLMRDYESAQREFETIRQKQMMAQLGETLEAERKGERFLLIEPPSQPTKPIKPKRLAILAIGFVLSIGAGIGTALLVDGLDKSIGSAKQLALMTGAAPLVVVPYIRTAMDVMREWIARLGVTAAVLATVVALLMVVDEFIMPLDVLYSILERQVEATFIRLGE